MFSMTIALWCVLAAILLPYLWTGIAKFGGEHKTPVSDNARPRAWLAELGEGPQRRAHWAQLNAFEVLPGFVAAVIIAELLGGAQLAVNILALVFIAFRLAHGFCYINNLATPRSLAWAGGMLCVVGLFVTAAV